MKKINRRDYLKRMGIAAAGTVAAGELDLFGTKGRGFAGDPDNRFGLIETLREPQPSTAPQASQASWPWTELRPDDPNPGVRLIFSGMMIFTHKGNEARVVFHRASPRHTLRILVLEIIDDECTEIYAIGGGSKPVQIKNMDLGKVDKDSRAAFFKREPFIRANRQGDDKDFRWLLDLEGSDFNGRKFNRKDDEFSTKLKVKHGTFYTYKHTGHYFKCSGGTYNNKLVGYVAKVMAADIPLVGGESVTLRIDGKNVLPYPLSTDAKYEIYFTNECVRDCDTAGDFPLAFDAIDINAGDKFTLVPIGGEDNGHAEGICIPLPKEHRLTDEAPCMGPGLGYGGGFP